MLRPQDAAHRDRSDAAISACTSIRTQVGVTDEGWCFPERKVIERGEDDQVDEGGCVEGAGAGGREMFEVRPYDLRDGEGLSVLQLYTYVLRV